jgi:hypothetical protein
VLWLLVVSGFSWTEAAQQYSFEEVASGLKHRDYSTRLRAIQILKDADYAEAVVPIAATLEDPDDRVQLAAIDAERFLFTTRPVLRREKIGFVIEKRTISGGDTAEEGQLALKARDIPTQVLSGLAVALRDNNLRVRAEAINLTSLRLCGQPRNLRSHWKRADRQRQCPKRNTAPRRNADARAGSLSECRSSIVGSVQLLPDRA